jgi:hypothetical protein
MKHTKTKEEIISGKDRSELRKEGLLGINGFPFV